MATGVLGDYTAIGRRILPGGGMAGALPLLKSTDLQTDPALIIMLVAAFWPIMQLVLGMPYIQVADLCRFSLLSLPPRQQPYLSACSASAIPEFCGFIFARACDLRICDGRDRPSASDSLPTAESSGLFDVPYANIALGPFVYPNQYAAFMELSLPVALAEAFAGRSGWRTFHGLAAVVMYASVIASASRTGFALTSIEVLMVPLLAARRAEIPFRQIGKPAAAFAAMLVILAMAVGPETLIAKLQQKDPYQGRREYMESSIRMIRDHPLKGVGMWNWSTTYPAYATFDDGLLANQAHNDWAQWAVEGGLPFALLILALAAWTLPKAIRVGWGIGLGAVFLQCLVDYPIQRIAVAFVFFTLVAAVCSAGGNRRSSSRK